jgi:hypothetical protein
MEPIEEQWNPPSSPDIMSDSWTNIIDTKRAVKIRILVIRILGLKNVDIQVKHSILQIIRSVDIL